MAHKVFKLDAGAKGFTDLFDRFNNLFAKTDSPIGPIWDFDAAFNALPEPRPAFPPEDLLTGGAQRYRELIDAATPYLPLAYRESYVAPLVRNLDRVVRLDGGAMHDIAETLTGAVIQHLPGSPVRQPLRQFLAVVSNLYRSFLAADKRISAGIPLAAPALPPLVALHHRAGRDSAFGPAVLPSPMTKQVCGSEVAVVVMPASYHRHPLAWLPLSHEACGHGVLQADPDLLPDLVAGIRTLFGGGPLLPGATKPNPDQALGLLWSYWVEETASDVYGLLNIGPSFALTLAAFLAARRFQPSLTSAPWLAVQSGGDPRKDLDVHPTDLLRLHVAIGVVENLVSLASSRVHAYVKALHRVADLCGKNAWSFQEPNRKIVVKGRVEVERDRWVELDLALDVDIAAESARRVGAYIATTRLGALGNRTIQDLETWDDADETVALAIHDALGKVPVVRRIEAGQEVELPISEALAELSLTKAEIDEIIERLRRDEFDKLSEDVLVELGLGGLSGSRGLELIAALREERIEAISDEGLIRTLELDRIDALGDDGQLLAGAALAALDDSSPVSYRWINRRLASALNRSHRHDAIMGVAEVHRMFDNAALVNLPPREVEPDVLEQAPDVGAGAKPPGVHPPPEPVGSGSPTSTPSPSRSRGRATRKGQT